MHVQFSNAVFVDFGADCARKALDVRAIRVLSNLRRAALEGRLYPMVHPFNGRCIWPLFLCHVLALVTITPIMFIAILAHHHHE